MKRALDLAASALGLLILSPLFLVLAIAIWLEDRESPWFRGVRVARGGGDFRMLKFRSMRINAWKSGVNSTAAEDTRITRVGRVLRRWKLDELPQLWNVLKGEMSLVGPRPQVRTDADLYTAKERKLLHTRPGITDLASIVFADEGEILAGSSDPDLLYNQIIRPWKSRLALFYVERQSLLLDTRILILTAMNTFNRRRALDSVGAILRAANADPLLRRMASRIEPLLAWPPPGSDRVLMEYPRRISEPQVGINGTGTPIAGQTAASI
jgi:lipopolysaccharide/colanic/teichoic acid biosynthesis glycosyltransferase